MPPAAPPGGAILQQLELHLWDNHPGQQIISLGEETVEVESRLVVSKSA